MHAFFTSISRLIYVLATAALMALACGFIIYACWSVYLALTAQASLLSAMLHAVGLLIIAMAVSDVGKFLLGEELAPDRDLETTGEVRRTLSKFITIIIVAASLEALVFLFEAGRDRLSDLVYPSGLLAVVAIMVAVLGLYQRLAHAAEHERRTDMRRGGEADPEKHEVQRAKQDS